MKGKFLVRDVKNVDTLVEIAQNRKIIRIIDVGTAGSFIISVVELDNNELITVKRNYYGMMDFSTEEQLKAFNNFSDNVKRVTGAYSNKYNVRC